MTYSYHGKDRDVQIEDTTLRSIKELEQLIEEIGERHDTNHSDARWAIAFCVVTFGLMILLIFRDTPFWVFLAGLATHVAAQIYLGRTASQHNDIVFELGKLEIELAFRKEIDRFENAKADTPSN